MATLMRDIYQVLYSKERQLEQVRREVEVLKFVIPLLQDESPVSVISTTAAAVSVIPFDRARAAAQRSSSALRD